MDLDEQNETLSPEVEAELLHRQETADDRSPVSMNELKARLVASALQPK
jgi:hypothetical protein